MTSKSEINQPSLNARVSAVALVAGSIAILVLAMQEHSLTPLRLMTLAINTFRNPDPVGIPNGTFTQAHRSFWPQFLGDETLGQSGLPIVLR